MRAKKIDLNQNEIVSVLRKAGCSVFVTSMVGNGFSDIAVGHNGLTYLFELKRNNKQKLTLREEQFQQSWKGHYAVLYSVDDAINWLQNVTTNKELDNKIKVNYNDVAS